MAKSFLPFTELRRLDCVLRATKPAVLATGDAGGWTAAKLASHESAASNSAPTADEPFHSLPSGGPMNSGGHSSQFAGESIIHFGCV